MVNMRHAARTDATQAEIVKALRSIGCQVYYIKLPVDLLVSGGRLGEQNLLMECKIQGEDLNGTQQDFWLRWPGRKVIVRSPQEAIEAVLGKELLR